MSASSSPRQHLPLPRLAALAQYLAGDARHGHAVVQCHRHGADVVLQLIEPLDQNQPSLVQNGNDIGHALHFLNLVTG